MALNVITAKFCPGQVRTWTDELWQYDYGQVLQFDGLSLPVAYEVHFANQPHGVNSTTQIGDADGVQIPDAYLLSGECVYAWIYLHDGETDGETEYMVTIPVTKRAKPTNQTPTPVQQDAITEAIAALNAAVEDAEELAGEWENMTATAETLPAGSQATASYSEGTLTLGIPKGEQGIQGIQGIPGQDGSPGAPGQDGEPGQDGFSPTVSVEEITGGHEVTITDADGDHSFDVMDGAQGEPGQDGSPGAPGADGYSPTATVTKSGDTATITITDKNGTTTATVSDGQNGQTGPAGPGVPTGGTTGQVLKKQSNTDFDSLWSSESVTDVKVDNTSILDANGVANIPKAATNVLGLVKIGADSNGLAVSSGTGNMYIVPANANQVKAGTAEYNSITPYRQHEAAFYGMAKAAGASMASITSPTIGIYPEAQKSAISDMLNAPETVSGSTPSITAKSGIRYVCGEVSTLDIVVPASGLFEVDFESGSTATVLTTTGTTVVWPSWFDPTDLDTDTLYEISIQDGKGLVATWPS